MSRPLRIKLCGIRTVEDARLCAAAGADELGVVFAPRSKRRVSIAEARAIRESLPPALGVIGVFQDAVFDGPEGIFATAREVGLSAVQLHGAIPPDLFSSALGAGFPLPIYIALQLTDRASLPDLSSLRGCARVLLDGPRGGSGESFPWALAREARAHFRGAIFVAGGLNPDNVAAAVLDAQPDGVDVASGIENASGRKDPALVRAFVHAAKAAAQDLPREISRASAHDQESAMSTRELPELFTSDPGPLPDARGRFGAFGGRFVPETLIPALDELESAFREARADPAYREALARLLCDYAGRPTPLFRANRLQTALGAAARIYLKREDLLHTGAHKLNNTLGQGLLAKRMGKQRFIAETGAGQHGVASATVAALLGLDCVVYMGAEDVRRQAPNVARMKLLGAEVRPVEAGARTLKDAMNEALRDWVTNVRGTYYCIGSAAGPHPYPLLVRELQKIIGEEIAQQSLAHEGRLPDAVLACVGGGSNAIGAFHRFIAESSVQLFGVEAAGHGLGSGKHGASMARGKPGILHGSLSYLLQDDDGQVAEAHSISAGLDYPGVGPELSHLCATGRLQTLSATDDEALAAVTLLARHEGILCALESAHAIAALRKLPRALLDDPRSVVVVNLSGRGDKDLGTLISALGGGAP